MNEGVFPAQSELKLLECGELGLNYYRVHGPLMDENTLWTEIIRLRKLELGAGLRDIVEEAANLLMEGRHMEAEALVQNAEARVRMHDEQAEVVAV